jgi:hypothetical protein
MFSWAPDWALPASALRWHVSQTRCSSTSPRSWRARASADVRERVNALWNEVEAYNARHPIAEAELERLFFYFGQYLERDDDAATSDDDAKGDDDAHV